MYTVSQAGFRRVGQSSYFAYALADKNHPSRRLAIEDDVVCNLVYKLNFALTATISGL
jgi:hypothetical protein